LANGTSLTWASLTFLTDLASDLSHRSGQFLSPTRLGRVGPGYRERLATSPTRSASRSEPASR